MQLSIRLELITEISANLLQLAEIARRVDGEAVAGKCWF